MSANNRSENAEKGATSTSTAGNAPPPTGGEGYDANYYGTQGYGDDNQGGDQAVGEYDANYYQNYDGNYEGYQGYGDDQTAWQGAESGYEASGGNPMMHLYPSGGEQIPENNNWGADGEGAGGNYEMREMDANGKPVGSGGSGSGRPPLGPQGGGGGNYGGYNNGSDYNYDYNTYQQQGPPPPPPPRRSKYPPGSIGGQDPSIPIEIQKARLEKGFELLKYEPKKHHWASNVCTEMCLSLFFKLYFSYQLYSVLVMFFFLTLDYLFAVNYRIFVPPSTANNSFWQSMAFFCLFFLVSFAMVTLMCAVMDMLHDFWTTTKEDTTLFRMKTCKKDKPRAPWEIHGGLVGFTIVIPAFWSLILMGAKGESIFFMAQFFLYISTIITSFIVLIVFCWLWGYACWEKMKSLKRRINDEDLLEKKKHWYHSSDEDDDEEPSYDAQGNPRPSRKQMKREERRRKDEEDTTGTKTINGKRVKTAFYHSETVMEEYGLDAKSITHTMGVMMVGLIPLFSVSMRLSTEGRVISMNGAWMAVGLFFFVIMVFIQQATGPKYRHYASISSMLLIFLLMILGLAGCSQVDSPGSFGVFFVAGLICQGLLLRKRNHKLTRKEINRIEHLEVFIDEEEDHELQEQLYDSYLCCCRNTLLACIRPCIEVRTIFGFTHPLVRAEEKKIRKERMAARTDQKLLLFVWVLMTVLLVVLLLVMQTSLENHETTPRVTKGTGVTVANPLPICNAKWNVPPSNSSSANVHTSLNIYDLGVLAFLSQHHFDRGYLDAYNSLFSHFPNFRHDWPSSIPSTTDSHVGKNRTLQFYIWKDRVTDYTVFAMASPNLAQHYMRDIDVWGDSMTLQTMGIFAPTINGWPAQQKADFVGGISFMKKALGGNDATEKLEAKIDEVIKGGVPAEKILLIGTGFAGGLAQIVAAQKGLHSVAFNPPGIGLLSKKYDFSPNLHKSTVVQVEHDIMASIDSSGARSYGTVQHLPCNPDTSSLGCHSIETLLNELLRGCGDEYGRTPSSFKAA